MQCQYERFLCSKGRRTGHDLVFPHSAYKYEYLEMHIEGLGKRRRTMSGRLNFFEYLRQLKRVDRVALPVPASFDPFDQCFSATHSSPPPRNQGIAIQLLPATNSYFLCVASTQGSMELNSLISIIPHPHSRSYTTPLHLTLFDIPGMR